MEISAINSLAEVGVGVNLAFGLIKGIRDRIGDRFKNSLELAVLTTQARLNEVHTSGAEQSKIAVDVSDIEQDFDRREDATASFLVLVAIVASIVDVVILYVSAMNPHMEVSPRTAAFAVGLAVGPISFSLLVNLVIYSWAKLQLGRKLDKYHSFAKMAKQMNVKITPEEPTE